jgi:hypothetical protein
VIEMTQLTKKSIMALAIATTLWGATATADNNDTATATVSGAVIASLSVDTTSTNGLIMPDLIIPDDSTSASVKLDCSTATSITGGTVTYTGGGNPFVNGNAAETGIHDSSLNRAVSGANFGTCAEFIVRGETGYHFLTTVAFTGPTTAITGIGFSGENCTSGSSTIGATTNIYCGGIITADNTAKADYADAGSITVTVVYD